MDQQLISKFEFIPHVQKLSIANARKIEILLLKVSNGVHNRPAFEARVRVVSFLTVLANSLMFLCLLPYWTQSNWRNNDAQAFHCRRTIMEHGLCSRTWQARKQCLRTLCQLQSRIYSKMMTF